MFAFIQQIDCSSAKEESPPVGLVRTEGKEPDEGAASCPQSVAFALKLPSRSHGHWEGRAISAKRGGCCGHVLTPATAWKRLLLEGLDEISVLLVNLHLPLKQFNSLFELSNLASHAEDQLPEVLLIHFRQSVRQRFRFVFRELLGTW